ncbi:hypothetical protein [Patulibacter sp.]|uniref:hypothetical protein n=1 Tax=Patulibacter sp. TaxID=1912859 RepID=UPI002720B58C|nr:hypothetical protein [Patulibacter sp.]MDO9407981.1 hypothetical protein [Patulibacter sp.]
MTQTPSQDGSPVADRRRETPRIRLARVAVDATSTCAGVAGLDRGPGDRYCTHVGGERLPGVVVIADGDPGTYGVAIHVRARLTDLHVLADDVRAEVRAAAARAGLEEHLGEIRIAITDIDDGSGA